MTSTTAPITVSMTLPLIGRFPRCSADPGRRSARRPSFRGPRLVVGGDRPAAAAAQDRAGRAIGIGGAGQVRPMLLLPRIAAPAVGARHLVDRVVQPGMPFRRHLGALGFAGIDHPALFAAEAAAPARELAPPLLAIVAIAETVGADKLTAEPSQQTRAKRHRSPISCRSCRRGAGRVIAPPSIARQ